MTWGEYFRNLWSAVRTLAWAWSALWNAVYFGRPDESISTRVGWSIHHGGAWSLVWLPGWLKRHFAESKRWKVTWE